MSRNLLEQVRSSCAGVAEQARHVLVQTDGLAEYAQQLPAWITDLPKLDPQYHYSGTTQETAAFVITMDAINFGSGYFPEIRKRHPLSGYYTMAAHLTDRFRSAGPLGANELADLSVEKCAGLFGQDLDDGPRTELMTLFCNALNTLGLFLVEHYGGSFIAPVEAAGNSAESLVRILRRMDDFNDVQEYDGTEVLFFKRAQLTAADLSVAFKGQGIGRFDDVDRLTMFADNLVPHVLRRDGLLQYTESLARRVDAGELLESGSPEEIKIRAYTVHAVELLTEHLRRQGREIRAMDLDFALWNRGQQPAFKAHPRHRTRTVYY